METRDFKRLKVLDKLQWFFDRMGVNYSVMRKILQVKMIMDERRVPTIFNQNKKKDGTVKKESNGFIKSLWVYLLMSLFLLPFIFLGGNYLFQMSLIFGIIMFMVMTTMVSDFSTVLWIFAIKIFYIQDQLTEKQLIWRKMFMLCFICCY